MSWIVRKHVAYLVFDDKEGCNSYTFSFEPFTNKVSPALFESQKDCNRPYQEALKKARELNKSNRES